MIRAVAFLTLVSSFALAPPAFARPAKREEERPPPVRLTTAATVARIPLPGMHGPVECSVDALARVIRLRPTKDGPATLLAKLAGRTGVMCPRVVIRDGAVELTCRSRRMEAQIGRDGRDGKGQQYLDINELRGLPWRAGADQAPNFFFDPWRVGIGQSCPGRADAARGECLLKQGHLLEAAGAFRLALTTQHRPMASLRLGDLALATGDPVTAIGWYRRVGPIGVFGQLARGRLCELEGTCLGSSREVRRAFNATGMPEPLRAETSMRAARAEAYLGRMPSAVKIMADQIHAHGVASLCREEADLLCRRILLQAMRDAVLVPVPERAPPARGVSGIAPGPTGSEGSGPEPDGDDDDEDGPAGADGQASGAVIGEAEHLNDMMQIFFALPSWDKGPLAIDLAQAGAAVAVRMGAPSFAGNLLSTVARDVPDRRLADHLLLAVEAFLRADDLVRARVVAEYVETRLGAKGRSGDRWRAAMKTLDAHDEEEEISSELRAEIEKELAASLEGLTDARAALDRAKTLMKGVKDAAASKPAAGQGGG